MEIRLNETLDSQGRKSRILDLENIHYNITMDLPNNAGDDARRNLWQHISQQVKEALRVPEPPSLVGGSHEWRKVPAIPCEATIVDISGVTQVNIAGVNDNA